MVAQTFAARTALRTGVYSFEQRAVALPAAYLARLKREPAAYAYFRARPPWYRRTATWWIVSAKREETRLKRLQQLIDDSAQGRHVPPLRRP